MTAFPAFFGLLMAALVTGQQNVIEISPSHAVRRVGDELVILCKVPYKITLSCRITVGQRTYIVSETTDTDELVYSGRGLEAGECGVRLRSIKEEWNGNIACSIPDRQGELDISQAMRLTVAKAPGAPELRVPIQSYYLEGDTYSAQCVVPDGRPAATISWRLGNETVVVGVHKAVVTSEPGSDLETISQNITRTLTADDGGKKLQCFAAHEALDEPRAATVQLVVHYPPKREETGPITIFGLKIGSEGRLNVTIRANPEPHAEWTVGDQRLVPGQTNDAATAVALAPLPLGEGRYNVTLVLHRVAKEDVDQTYYLRVTNDLGHEELPVRISTMDEPAGVELETGAIVGIVIAVLVLVIAISLVVFAKATDRWCFGGRSHRTDIPDGADSEAPLPPHDDFKGSENPSHDHGDYFSNGNTKHPEKKPDTAV